MHGFIDHSQTFDIAAHGWALYTLVFDKPSHLPQSLSQIIPKPWYLWQWTKEKTFARKSPLRSAGGK